MKTISPNQALFPGIQEDTLCTHIFELQHPSGLHLNVACGALAVEQIDYWAIVGQLLCLL